MLLGRSGRGGGRVGDIDFAIRELRGRGGLWDPRFWVSLI